MKNKEENEELFEYEPEKEAIQKVKKLVGKNRGAALGLAVFFALSTSLAGCSARGHDEEEDDSYYSSSGGHVGSYYYSSGARFTQGSWTTKSTLTGAKIGSYSSKRGGSIGG